MTTNLAVEALRHTVAKLPGDTLTAFRQAAVSRLADRGLPTVHDEDWKYTDLSPIVELGNRWLSLPDGGGTGRDLPSLVERICREIDADWIVIANGDLPHRQLKELALAGVRARLLSASGRNIAIDSPLGDLNTALLKDGLDLRIDRNFQGNKPLGILLTDGTGAGPGLSQQRVNIELTEGASAEIIEYHASCGDGEHFSNTVVNIGVAGDACLRYVRLQDRATHHSHANSCEVRLGRNGSLRYLGLDLGGKLVRNDLRISLADPGADAALTGLYLAGNGQHIDNHIRVDHRVGPATSNQEYRGILQGAARAVWNGKAIVHPGADGTDARQENHNLLLSEQAEIDAKPELEIYADDVKCSHGTTIGQLDESALYYLRTRGIGEFDARRLLTEAFARIVVETTPIESLRSTLADLVGVRLADFSLGDRR